MTQNKTKWSAPCLIVRINEDGMRSGPHPLKRRLQAEHLSRFWNKLKFDQKTISQSCEDRLCELTIQQIDRLIDMERIKNNLYDKKMKKSQQTFQTLPNQHSNVYQANFIARMNRIAIQRNLRREQVDNDIKLKKKAYLNSFKMKGENKYVKQVTNKVQNDKEECKSIQSFDDDLNEFEKKLTQQKIKKIKIPTNKKQWFQGMSLRYINHQKKQNPQIQENYQRTNNFDLQSQLQRNKDFVSTHNSLMKITQTKFNYSRIKTISG